MKSMTGYGKGIAASDGREVTVEIKAVNNRFLEVSARLPKVLMCAEDMLRSLIQKRVARGSVEVFLRYASTADAQQKLTADYPLIESYAAIAKEVNAKTGIENDFSFTALLRVPDAVRADQAEFDAEAFRPLITEAGEIALKALNIMRDKEGRGIIADLSKLLKAFEESLKQVKLRAPLVLDEYRAKLQERVSEFLKAVEPDEARLVNEVAFFADKCDVNEELQRLDSHIVQFKEAIEGKGPSGRKLDFISQEMVREVNTLGSKANDAVLTNYVVELKNLLEKIKEQIRNVE